MNNEASPLANVRAPSEKRIAIRITPEAERAIRDGHPWLYAEAIQRQSHDGRSGDLAVIFDRKGRFLAVGLYDPDSPIRVRVLQHARPTPINQDWFAGRIDDARHLRSSLAEQNSTGYRLVHGENDGLPGLIIDRYADTYVLKIYSSSWIGYLQTIVNVLSNEPDIKRCILRLNRQLQSQDEANYGLSDGLVLNGPPLQAPVTFSENGLTFTCDPVYGQKTGFFLDQRENRQRVEKLSSGKRVLNVFSYTGGFSLYAARGGAPEVVSLDLSRPALATAERHFALNERYSAVASAQHETLQGDAFQLLSQMAGQDRQFDMVILDPPAFAHKRSEVAKALNAYRRLTRLGLGVLRPGGILMGASCSRPLPANEFYKAVVETAAALHRPLREIDRSTHAIDHPINFKEGAYLKAIFAVVG